MQFESLKVFCDVARLKSFSLAASSNHLSQSAASQIVSQLEKRLGVDLVDRSTRPLELTTPGQAYYEGCKTLYDQYLELEAAVRVAQHKLETTVSVAAIYSVGLAHMGEMVERFSRRYPDAKIQI